MKKNYTLKKLILDSIMLCCLLLLASNTAIAQNINFTIDTAVSTGTLITETITDGPDTYVLTIDHQQDVENLDDLGGGDLIFFLGSGSSSTPFVLTITRNGTPTNFNLNSIDYDSLEAGTIAVTNQNNDFISDPTSYPANTGTLTFQPANAANALNITQINIVPGVGDIDALNDFGFHNINVNMLNTLSVDEVSTLDSQVIVSPNPSNGNITIKNSGIVLNEVTITDINGRTIEIINLNGIITDKNLDLSSKLSSGLYFMTISTENTTTIKKLIIE